MVPISSSNYYAWAYMLPISRQIFLYHCLLIWHTNDMTMAKMTGSKGKRKCLFPRSLSWKWYKQSWPEFEFSLMVLFIAFIISMLSLTAIFIISFEINKIKSCAQVQYFVISCFSIFYLRIYVDLIASDNAIRREKIKKISKK